MNRLGGRVVPTLRTTSWVVAVTLGITSPVLRPGLVTAASAVVVIAFASVGVLVASRQRRNAMGWVLLLTALSVGALFSSAAYVDVAVDRGWAVPVWVQFTFRAAWVPTVALLLGPALLLFPDGRVPSRRWRPVLVLTAAFVVLGTLESIVGIPPTALVRAGLAQPGPAIPAIAGVVDALGGLAAATLAVLSLSSLSVRFRRGTPRERDQLKWLILAGLTALPGMVAGSGDDGPQGPVGMVLLLIAFAGVPVAMGIAILRHRLYDIDRLLNRTVVYAVVTVVLGGLYAAVAVLPTTLLDLGDSDLLVAAATLAAAGAFRPVRRSVQAFVDRRFNRSRYDAARTIETFTARLRDQVQLDTLADELRAIVGATVQPRAVSVWVRPVTVPERSHP